MKKLFGTDGVRGKFNQYPMDLETISKLVRAAAIFFQGKKCLIGRDTRESGEIIEKELVKTLTSLGVDVFLLGVCTSPGTAFLTKRLEMDFGIVISASHNPYHDNGIKFFNKLGFKLTDQEEEEIEGLFDAPFPIGEGDTFDIARKIPLYLDLLKESGCDLTGLKIVLDCAHGAASHIAPEVFYELGAEVIVVNNSPTGININDNCGATCPENIRERVLQEQADVGITLDGDADRVMLLDEAGKVLDGDAILSIVGQDKVVGTVLSNIGLEKHVGLLRSQVGDRYVVQEMLRNNIKIGGEPSGHLIFLDYNNTGDGILSALQVLKKMKEESKKLSELNTFEPSPQIAINVGVKEKLPLSSEIKDKIKEVEEKLGSEGRVLVRYSGTQNLLRVMVEGRNKDIIENYAQEIADLVKNGN